MRLLSALLLVLSAVPLFAADPQPEPFEIREGDRVLLLGDTLLERENSFGYLEARLHEQFADRKFTVRNLSWAGDTPRGWSRASFDGPEKGWERLKEQIALIRPTVVFLGYGMAASLQELTDRSGDHTLNPDPARYGAEPMTAARFKQELAQLMDAITTIGKTTESTEAKEGKSALRTSSSSQVSVSSEPSVVKNRPVRFVLLSPIRHEDLRASRPGLPHPAPHNALLEQYSNAIREVAAERSGRFLDLATATLTENGIHLSERGYAMLSEKIAGHLGLPAVAAPRQSADLRSAILRKNDLFFHQFRPANSTYLFGFRKHEQGQNAKEIAQFEPLIEAAEAEIDRVKRTASARPPVPEDTLHSRAAQPTQLAAPRSERAPAQPPVAPSPLPEFAVAEGYQIELWAENPLLEKPTQINWDAQGRLWVCSSSLYPQIAPGEPARDKILILEDTDRDGKADKSEVFADGLLIPTGVEPDYAGDLTAKNAKSAKEEQAAGSSGSPSGSSRPSRLGGFNSAGYVGQSTELLHFADTDGDGRADQKRIVFSGFGTEDTHHIIHTLHWGPDGRLYFNQSVYIHSHIETPHGMVRLNSGGIFAYNPRSERLEVFARGWWNSWGHQMDKWGQSFATDGAGNTGISWVIPGGVYQAYEGGRRIAPGVSPGSYPKFCGLEIVHSPHFPADWQGNAITCDFRAHRIVRFAMEDLSGTTENTEGTEGKTKPGISTTPSSSSVNSAVKPTEAPLSNIVNAATAPLQKSGSAGYLAKEQPDIVRTSDLSFRPIDVKLGPTARSTSPIGATRSSNTARSISATSAATNTAAASGASAGKRHPW
jgi:hypothetical protein